MLDRTQSSTGVATLERVDAGTVESSDTKPVIYQGRQMVTIAGAAELAQVSIRTIFNWLNRGRVEYVRTVGGSVRIYADSLFRSAGGGEA